MTEQELEVYFRQMNDLFRTEGWGLLIEDFKQQVPNIRLRLLKNFTSVRDNLIL